MQLKVVWHEGLFMQPHHLQQQERYLEGYTWSLIREIAPLSYGFTALDVDEIQLGAGQFSLRQADGLMPDGASFSLASEFGQAITLRLPPTAARQTIHLCLAAASSGANEMHYDKLGSAGHNKRFLVVDAHIADVATQDAEKVVAQLALPNLQLKLERDMSGNEISLPVARVHEVQADGKVVLDPGFIPPVLRCRTSPILRSYLKSALQLVENRADSLATRLSQPAQRGVGEIVDFLSLQLLNRYRPLLKHLESEVSPSPLDFYRLLLQLLGELSTYLSEKRSPGELPAYNHDNLAQSFDPLMLILQRYLVEVLDQTVVEIPVKDKGGGYKLAIVPDSHLLQSAQFVLAVHADVPAETLTQTLPQSTKIGAVEHIQNMVNRMLPGVLMRHLNVAPAKLPFLPGYSYFELEMRPDQRAEMQAKSAVAMHLAHAWPGLKIMLWAMKK